VDWTISRGGAVLPKYNTSLLAYMQGLKGDAAKVRMSNAARDVIKADIF
jgi:hypothetical protein